MPAKPAAANAAALPQSRSYVDLEGPISDLAMAVRLIRKDFVGAASGPGGTIIIPVEIHWGLLQVIDRTEALYDEFYAVIENGRKAAQ